MNEDRTILKRETAGRYRSADGRFTVESQGANDWYVADEEQVDQLGQPVLRGPFATLADARAAVAEARSTPVVGRKLPNAKVNAAAAGKTATRTSTDKGKPERARRAARGRSAGASTSRELVPAWLADIEPERRPAARGLADELRGLGLDDPENLVRDDFTSDEPVIAEAILAHRLGERLGSDKDARTVLDFLRDEGFRPGAGRPPFGWRLIELDRQGRPTQRRLRVRREK